MAIREGTRASSEFICVSILPDVCKSPTILVPYKILSLFDSAVGFSTDVKFRKQFAFHHDSRLSTVRCNEAGVGGGVLSGVNMGFCRPIPGTHSKTVRVNGSFVDYHEGTYMFMNCAGPEGPYNTIGQVLFLGNMLPGPVAPGGKIPKGCFCSTPGMFSDIKDMLGSAEDLVKTGKKLYDLAKIDWSDPSAVLGSIGGVAGIAGLQDIAGAAKQVKGLYDLGDKAINTDWSDPKQVLGTIAGAANMAGMEDISKAAQMADKIRDTVNTDWSDPSAAMAAATNIMRSTGLNEMVAAMGSNAILGTDIPVPLSNNAPKLFPEPGAANPSGQNAQTSPPPSPDKKPRQHVTADVLEDLRKTNPAAAERYNLLSQADKNNAFVETSKGGEFGDENTAIYLPREGFSTTQAERDKLPNVSKFIPREIRELFVASKKDATEGNFFGIKEKEGNVYLFGGLIDLGSPEMPGAGNAWSWWVPDRILNMDMSPYYDYHDKEYYGSDLDLSDMGRILSHEVESFKKGAKLNPLQLPLQAIYSAGTTLVGALSAAGGSVKDAGSGTFDSLGDFYDNVFGGDSAASDPIADLVSNIMPHAGGDPMQLPASTSVGSLQSVGSSGCWGGADGGGAGGGGAGAGTAGSGGAAPPSVTPVAGAPVCGAGTDGILITTAPGNPTAAAAEIEAQFRADNAKAYKEAQDKEKARKKAEVEAKRKQEEQKRVKEQEKSSAKDQKALRPKGGISLQEAQQASDIAYGTPDPNNPDSHIHPKVGDKTRDGNWIVKEVTEHPSGMNAVLLESNDPNDPRKILAYRGSDNDHQLRKDWVETNVPQIAVVPKQYFKAAQLAGQMKAKYGDDLVLAGHSQGGGQANYAGAIHGIPGVGINSAPLGLESRGHIAFLNPKGSDDFIHYRHPNDIVSSRPSPGKLLGEVVTVMSPPSSNNHDIFAMSPDDPQIIGYPKPPPAPSQSWPDGARRPGEVTYSKPHINNSDPNGPGAIRH